MWCRTTASPWFEAGVERAADHPLVIQRVGALAVQVRAADVLLVAAARAVDAARADLTAGTASSALAAAKAFADPVAIETGNAVFELGGTRSSLDGLNLHRHSAPTHTLHDPARRKLQPIGRYVLDGRLPPRHGLRTAPLRNRYRRRYRVARKGRQAR